jgi:Spy/CpxP family protein refolding chaperone
LKESFAPFLLGVLVGAGLAFYGGRHMHRSFRDMENRHKHMLDRFSRKLDLTPEQRQKVGAIMEESGKKMRSLWDESRPKAEALRKETADKIRALLNPDQIKKFDAFQKEM